MALNLPAAISVPCDPHERSLWPVQFEVCCRRSVRGLPTSSSVRTAGRGRDAQSEVALSSPSGLSHDYLGRRWQRGNRGDLGAQSLHFPLPQEMVGGVGYMNSPISRLMGPGSGEEKEASGFAPQAELDRDGVTPPTTSCSACSFLLAIRSCPLCDRPLCKDCMATHLCRGKGALRRRRR